MKKYFVHHSLLFIIILYTLFRLFFLWRLPLFNDESIYLDWGWKEIHVPGALFYSLIDGKQPFLMWIFGISQSVFSDPLFAGRIISIFGGLLTLMGVYFLCRKYINIKVAVLSSFLYTIIPIFSTFDRLALMESAISACGVWSLYFLLNMLNERTARNSIYLGLILGVGFLIKSNALLFLLAIFLIGGFNMYRESNNRVWTLKSLTYVVITFILTISLLLLQPLYWQTLSMNSRYTLTFSELLGFPLAHTLGNLWVNIQIIFFFITPPLSILALWGLVTLGKEKSIERRTIVFWFMLLILLQILLVRNTSQRYLVSYLPLFVVFASYALWEMWEKSKNAAIFVLIIISLLPFILTFWQMKDPISSLLFLKKITPYTEAGLIEGQISGYGINKIIQKLRYLSDSSPAYISTAINIGNPESAIPLYFHDQPAVRTGYLDKKMFGNALSGYQCLSSTIPLYYVSRDQQQSDMNDYLEEIYRVKHPISDYSLGIYQLKKSCKGKTLQINPMQ